MARTRRAEAAKPQSAALVAAFAAGAYEEIEGDTRAPRHSDDVAILRARALVRLRQFEPAEAILADLQRAAHRQTRQSATVLRAELLVRRGDAAGALTELRDCDILGDDDGVYVMVLAYFALGRDDDARRSIEERLPTSQGRNAGRLWDVLGWIDFRQARPQSATRSFERALGAFEERGGNDATIRASSLHGLSLIAAETLDPTARAEVLRRLPSMTWPTPDLWRQYQTLQSLAWAQFHSGEIQEAWDLLERARNVAPSPGYALAALINRAEFYSLLGEPFAARHAIVSADEVASQEVWGQANVEERVLLLELARVAVTHSSDVAVRALMRYENITGQSDPLLTFDRDPRTSALQAEVLGRLQHQRGDLQAIRYLRAALDVWNQYEYLARAFSVATLIQALEPANSGKSVQLASERAGLRLSRSPLYARRVSAPPASAGRVRTLVQRRLLERVLEGKKPSQIAQELGRSEHTIRNGIKRLLRLHGVKSRPALMALYSAAATAGTSVSSASAAADPESTAARRSPQARTRRSKSP